MCVCLFFQNFLTPWRVRTCFALLPWLANKTQWGLALQSLEGKKRRPAGPRRCNEHMPKEWRLNILCSIVEQYWWRLEAYIFCESC